MVKFCIYYISYWYDGNLIGFIKNKTNHEF